MKGLDYRTRSLELSKFKLDKNEIEVSEYMGSLQDFTEERDEFHNAMSDYFLSKADLNHAVGIQDFVPVKEFLAGDTNQRSAA